MRTPSSLVANNTQRDMAASSSTSCSLLLLVATTIYAMSLPCTCAANAGSSRHLTAGFIRVKLNESQFVVQKPYNVPLQQRYEQRDGVRRMWVFATDKPISSTHPGGARTEIKVNVRDNSKTCLCSRPFAGLLLLLLPILTPLHELCRRSTAPACGSSRATCTCRRARRGRR
jgi:hypothetical protein